MLNPNAKRFSCPSGFANFAPDRVTHHDRVTWHGISRTGTGRYATWVGLRTILTWARIQCGTFIKTFSCATMRLCGVEQNEFCHPQLSEKPLRQRLFVNQRICGWMAARRYECWVSNYSSMIIIAKTSYQWVALSAMKPAALLCRDFMYASKTGTDRLIILQNVLSWLVLRCCVFTVQCRCIQHTEISYRKTRLCGTEHMKKISSFLSGKW